MALKEATGKIILGVDAHTSIPEDFIQCNVECIESDEDICGGKVESIVYSNNNMKKTLLISGNSALGGGIAKFRRSEKKNMLVLLLSHHIEKKYLKKLENTMRI